MAAKVDSSLVQDGYQLYHHSFFFSKNGAWTVVQQGMSTKTKTARRYHWNADAVTTDFVDEPHSAITSQLLHADVMNLVAKASNKTREVSTELVQSSYATIMKDLEILRHHSSSLSRMIALRFHQGRSLNRALRTSRNKDRPYQQLTLLELADTEFHHHPVEFEDFRRNKYLEKILQKVTYYKPEDYESFLAMEGVGPKTVRALSLVSEVIYGAKPSYEDPARYSFAHGGKDGTPYPVDKPNYDKVIAILQEVVEKTKLNAVEKNKALRRLAQK